MRLYVAPEKRIPLLLTAVFLVWVYGWLWWALGACAVGYLCWSTYKRLEDKRATDAALVARADYEHALTLAGDEMGVYGQGYGAVREYQRVACPTLFV